MHNTSIIKLLFITLLLFGINACGGGGNKNNASDNNSSNANSSSSSSSITGITINAWIGSQDTVITFPSSAKGFNFYRSSTNDCDFTHILNCINGQSNILNTLQVTDTAATLSRAGYYQLSNGSQHSKLIIGGFHLPSDSNQKVVNFNNQLWRIGGMGDVWSSDDGIAWIEQTKHAAYSNRLEYEVTIFNNKLWMVGGYDYNLGTEINDVWSSSDGITWVQEIAHAAFSVRAGHRLITHNNKLWVIGGYGHVAGYGTNKNDVWSSVDGSTWVQEVGSAPFPGRYEHQAISYNGKLWVIGGLSDTDLNDVWSSPDGISWTQQTNNAAFSPRYAHQVSIFNNKLWLIGGTKNNVSMNDIWSSVDGVSWSLETANASFSARYSHQLIAYNTKLWVIGGYVEHPAGDEFWPLSKNDVWSSVNGTNWDEQNSSPNQTEFSVRTNHNLITYNNQLWLIGGYGGPEVYYNGSTYRSYQNDIWSSFNELNWTKHTRNNTLPDYYGHFQVTTHNNQLWIIQDESNSADHIWTSTDGNNWTLKKTNTAFNTAFSSRSGSQLISFNNKLWLIGGYIPSEGYKNDIWSSTDGQSWKQETNNAAFNPRASHQLITFNNQLLLIGGTDYIASSSMNGFVPIGGSKNDIWTSTDGINWTLLINTAAFSNRSKHQVVKYNDKLWLIGGTDGNRYYNDVWSSTDGFTWTEQSNNAAFSPRIGHQVVTFNNQLLLIGGYDDDYNNDIWSSTDGIEWRKGFRGIFQFP